MPEVTPHTLRHTGGDLVDAKERENLWATAGYLGMSVEQLERTYGHHHGDHLKSCAGRVRSATRTGRRPPISRQSNSGTKRDRMALNVGRKGP